LGSVANIQKVESRTVSSIRHEVATARLIFLAAKAKEDE
jgi:hypothetical protein